MSNVLRVYQDVIDDVILAVRELFMEDGVDEQILQELKQSWESKLVASKAVESHTEEKGIKKSGELANGNAFPKGQNQVKQVVGQVAPNNHVQTQVVTQVEQRMVPIQITLPSQPGANGTQRILTIQVPATALQDNQLHKVLTGPIITATMNLSPHIASSVLQQHVNAAFNQQLAQPSVLSSVINNTAATAPKSVIQNDGASQESDEEEIEYNLQVPSCSKPGTNNIRPRKRLIAQHDGPDDTSDEEEEGSDDDEPSDDNDDDKDEDEQEMDEGGPEEEPLNSEDDVTDEDPTDLFDTENVVVCQYDKITRSRNKWKFHLKDGIMNLNGEDFVFQKASGDAEW
ncbi:PREDICTED: transcription initiation factor IIA subunit 1-like isoform X2 [Nicrophorus vespilloides]|uniref:Transcription initiation factor IIA subunit 1-like isoform X2 n=1 Tax=Nicrophorus vespilloides TaxID=110193 RepID=A0ABM1MVU4_NICVS|nr:PREDICTED: transcription initiation factor IIA subunit 1-like isoform X2 [Nicrophorus vespilloides]